MAGSCVVEDEELLLGDELLAPPLGVLELGELGLVELELLLELGELELAPPEAEPDLVSLDADPLMLPEGELEEDGLDGLEGLEELDDEAPPDGDVGELLGEDDVLELGEPDEVLLLSPRSHAARPRASATATAIAESFMCPPWVGVQGSSKLRARPKPLIEKGLNRARRTLFRGDGSSYLLLELPELLGLELGLEGAFFEALLLVEPVLELPLAPDVLEPLGDDVEPPEADLLLSRSHPVTRAVPRDNASAATNAVNFMLTSMVVCAN